MKITLESPVNKYYVQTLGMIFFPGEHFGNKQAEEEPSDEPCLYVRSEDRDGGVYSYAKAEYRQKCCEAEYFAEQKDGRTAERTLKLSIGGAVLAALGDLMGYRPAWGMMIGVRPSKVASEMLNAGVSKTRVKKILNSDYLVIPKKAALATDIALTEKRIIGEVSPKDCSVYISIPFCPSRCTYCSFVSYTSKRLLDLIPEYIERLKVDIRANFETIDKLGLRVRTLYIGGGTPTILSEEQLKDLLSYIYTLTDVTKLDEYTMEAGRPDTITEEKLTIAREYGVTRVSVNPQSLSDDVLYGIGRHHTAEDFFRAFSDARRAKIKTVNVDLIAGLPGDNFKRFSATMDKVLQMAPENITVHTFCVKKSAEILKLNSDVYSIRGGDAGKCVDYSQIKAQQAGYIPYYMYRQKNTVGNYENVGFALHGHEGLYNIYMMEEIHSIFAAGAGAVTKLVDNRNIGSKSVGTDGIAQEKRTIERLFHQKYPYEYLAEDRSCQFARTAEEFYREHGML
ncbi:MAG: coproporphyrinogen dehydrogenase HemZ [Clostridia bacterium]|nr:coproporphyrinogen dehydrogenase HemZ [Clostridia bacterium]